MDFDVILLKSNDLCLDLSSVQSSYMDISMDPIPLMDVTPLDYWVTPACAYACFCYAGLGSGPVLLVASGEISSILPLVWLMGTAAPTCFASWKGGRSHSSSHLMYSFSGYPVSSSCNSWYCSAGVWPLCVSEWVRVVASVQYRAILMCFSWHYSLSCHTKPFA